MTNTGHPVIVRVSHRFDAAAERVYDAFLDPAKASQFLFATATGEIVRCDIDDSAAEDLGQLADFGSLAGLHLDLDQHEVAFDMVVGAHVVNANDGDNLFELLADLREDAIVADDDKGHPREAWAFGFADREAIDVESA